MKKCENIAFPRKVRCVRHIEWPNPRVQPRSQGHPFTQDRALDVSQAQVAGTRDSTPSAQESGISEFTKKEISNNNSSNYFYGF